MAEALTHPGDDPALDAAMAAYESELRRAWAFEEICERETEVVAMLRLFHEELNREAAA